MNQAPTSPDELIDAILDAVAELTPAQRRQLQRRLSVAGLLVPATLVTDQQRLQAAPALGSNLAQTRAAKATQATPADIPPNTSFVRPSATEATTQESSARNRPKQTQPQQKQPTKSTSSFLSALPPAKISPAPVERLPANFTAGRMASNSANTNQANAGRAAPYRSPISGKVVVGSPNSTESKSPDPHLMPPLPGQAPERPLILVVERGSYMLRWPGEAPQRVRLTFRAHVTEQEAFYDTLIGVLETVEQRLHDAKADPQSARLDIRCADGLFVQQIRGEIPCEDITLRVRRTHALKLLDHFLEWRIVHQT